MLVHTTACKRFVSPGCVAHTDGAVLQGKIDQPLYPQSDPLDVHPDERVVEAKAGSVIVFNAHTFHAGRANTTVSAHRRALHCYFVERGQKQQTDQRAQLRPETAARISPLQRYILNVD